MIPLEGHRCLATICEWGAFSQGIEFAAIEIKRQMRLHLDFTLGSQVADKRNAQLQIFELMLLLHRLVIELNASITQSDVVERKAQRLGRLFILCLAKLGDHIVNIEPSHGMLSQSHYRPIQLYRIEHRRQPKQRLRAEIDQNTLDLQLGLGCIFQVF